VLTLITPTHGRPQAFALLERWISRQTYKGPMEWIVGLDSDPAEYAFTMGQTVWASSPMPNSMLSNLSFALPRAKGDLIAFVEDDDWYHPEYLQNLVEANYPASDMIGTGPAHYYRVTDRTWRCMGNKGHCSLAQTAIPARTVPKLLEIIAKGRTNIDMQLWTTPGLTKQRLANTASDGRLLHVGIKGMPGTPGIGVGHGPDFNGRPDPEGKQLREMMGEDAEAYLPFEVVL
jgi:hypothetical protein